MSIRSVVDSLEPVGAQLTLMLRFNYRQFRVHISPQALVHSGANQNFATAGACTIAVRPVGRLADNGQLHTIFRSDEAMEHFAAMDANADSARHLTAPPAFLADFLHRGLHRQGRSNRFFMS